MVRVQYLRVHSSYYYVVLQAYRWDDNVAVVDWLSQQLDEDRWQQSFLCENIRCVQRDHIMQRMRS